MRGFHVGFTGTQRGMTTLQQSAVVGLTAWLRGRASRPAPFWAHHGDCVGADAQFHNLAILAGAVMAIHPPLREGKRAFCAARPGDVVLAPQEYLVRNRAIVAASNVMVATPAQREEQWQGSGTWAAIRYTRRTGTPLAVVYPDGSVERERWPEELS